MRDVPVGSWREWVADPSSSVFGTGIGVEKVVARRQATGEAVWQKTALLAGSPRGGSQSLHPGAVESFLYTLPEFAEPGVHCAVPGHIATWRTERVRAHLLLEDVGTSLYELRGADIEAVATAAGEMNRRLRQQALERVWECLPSAPSLGGRHAARRLRKWWDSEGNEYLSTYQPDRVKELGQLIEALSERAPAVHNMPRTLSHRDMHRMNVRRHHDRVTLLDWGSAGRSPFGVDVAKMLVGTGAQSVDPEDVAPVLEAYQDAIHGVISVSDVALVAALVQLEWMFPFVVGHLRKAPEQERMDGPHAVRLKNLTRVVTELAPIALTSPAA